MIAKLPIITLDRDRTGARAMTPEENRPYTAGGGYPNEPDQIPRVPDLWWTPEHGVLEDFRGSYLGVDGQSILDELPADAVKLGDVEALQAELATARGARDALLKQIAIRDAQMAEIRTAVRAQPTTSHAFTMAHIHQIVAAAGQKRAAEDVRAALSAAPVAKEEQ